MPAAGDARLGWRTLRASQWPHFLVIPALPLHGLLVAHPAETVLRGAAGACVAALCLGFAYGVNAIADREADASDHKNPLAGRDQVPSSAWAAAVGSGVAAVGIAMLISRWLSPLAAALSLLASAAYSLGPRLKRWPVIGTLTNWGIFIPLALLERVPYDANTGLLLATFATLLTQSQLVHETGDLAEDRRSGVRSTAVVLGPAGAMRAAGALGGIVALGIVCFSGVNRESLVAAVTVAACGAWLARAPVDDAASARRQHRWLAFALGGALYLLVVWSESVTRS